MAFDSPSCCCSQFSQIAFQSIYSSWNSVFTPFGFSELLFATAFIAAAAGASASASASAAAAAAAVVVVVFVLLLLILRLLLLLLLQYFKAIRRFRTS